MTDPRAPRRMFVRVAVSLALAGLLAVLALGPAGAASASLGSVPAQVAAYVANGGMVARLADVYGKNGAGAGIDFDETTKAGPISRVYEWTAARLKGAPTDHPVQLTNNWVVPIMIGGDPVGLATIWINPQSVAPELADFAPGSKLATAMATVPPTAALVRDSTTHAWLALAGDSVTPLIAGTSGLTKPVSVSSLKLGAAAAPAPAAHDASPGLVLAICAVGVVVVAIVVALLLSRRRRPTGEKVPQVVAAAESTPEPVAVPASAAPGPAAPGPKPATVKAATARPATARPAASRPSSPVTKPVGSKPGGRTSASAAASTKPRTQKPPIQKPPAQKPPTSKPPARKPPSPKPPRPPAEPES